VENADATTVASALLETLSAAGARAARGQMGAAAAGQLRISADRSSNCLVVRASKEAHEKIVALLKEMDTAPTDKYPVRTIALTSADVTELAQSLNSVFGTGAAGARGRAGGAVGAKSAVVIEGDAGARMLLVRADDETFKKIQDLVTKLDVPTGKASHTLVPLKHAKAELVAASLSQAFTAQRGARVSPDDLVSVVADASTNAIIVTANAANLDKVKALLAQLDTETAGTRTELLLLKSAKASELADVLTQIVSKSAAARGRAGTAATPQGVTIAANDASNALIVSGPTGQMDEVMQMALQLDRATEATISSIHIVPLKNGDASTVAAMLRDLYTQQERAARANRQTIDPLAVTADVRANALVVATTNDMYEKVSKWVADIEQMKPARGAMRLIQLKNVDPEEVEKAIQQLFNAPSGGARGPEGVLAPRGRTTPTGTSSSPPGTGRVQTSLLGRQRAILIQASDEDYEVIKQLAEALDKAAMAAKHVPKLFVLQKANNTRVATALTSMYRALPGVTPRPEDQVTITALAQTNAIVVSAAQEKMEEVTHLIEQLDKEQVAPQLEFRIYPLQNAMPTKVMPALQQMLTQIRKVNPEETIDVQADERTRAIIVTAKGTLFDQIEKIVKALDKPPAHAKVEVLIIALKKADATRLAQVLTDMIQPGAGTQLTPEAKALQEHINLLRIRAAGLEQIPELDLTKPIKITADPIQPNQQGSNSLVITSTPENLQAMKAIVEIMDTVPLAEGAKVRLLHLKNADAVSVQTILQDIFTQGMRLAGRQGSSVAGKAVPETVSGKALVYPLNASVDVRTNTLVLSGLEESLALAELIVLDLDREEGKIVTEVRLFKLKDADAARMLPMLQAVFAEAVPTAAAAGAEGLRTQVTRLRTALKDKLPKESVYAKTRPALAIQADPATNILIVAARSDVMPLIADVIQTMDIPGAGSLNTVRIYPLANADAPAVQQVLTQLHSGPNAQLIRAEDRPTIAADNRTNALVISANEKTFEVIERLLKHLDVQATIAMHDVRLVPLKSAEAQTLAPVLQQMMDARVQRQAALGVKDAEALRMLISFDARSNSLIVGGGKEGFALVQSLAEQLDAAAPALGGQVQFFPLVHANAGTLSTTLTTFFTQRYQAARTPDLPRQRPIILPDLRTNSVLAAANADDTKILTSLLKKLDVELVDPAVRLEVIPLKHNDAGVVGPTIQQIFQARLTSMTPQGTTPAPQDRVDVVTDSLSNSLVVSASKENLTLIRDLLKKVDVEPPMESGVVRIFPLKNSDAQRVATMLQSLIQQGLYKPGAALAAQQSPALAAREKVAIVVDLRTNSLVVSASKENFAVLEEIIRKIDETGDFGALGDIRMYTLKNADATQLGPTLQGLFDAKRQAEIAAGGSGRTLQVSFVPDARTNTLLVAGSRESFAAIEEMLKQLDSDQVVAATQFRVFRLKHATATTLQPTLTQLFTQRVTRGQTRDPVTILADARANTLIVGASPHDMKLAEALIQQLDDAEAKPGTALTSFSLEKGDATQVANTLRTLYQAQGAAAGAVTIGVDERTNTIIVSAGPADVKRIADLIKELDKAQVTSVSEIRVFTLLHADATELSGILISTLTNKPTPLTAGSPNRQTLLQFISTTTDGKELIATALQEGVLITPDRRSNSLVVVAPVRNLPLLESLIRALDSTSPRLAEIRVFALKNADAQQMATVLTQLFRLQVAAAGAKAVSYTLVTTRPAGDAATATLGSAEQDALTVTVDVRTNSLLVGGTKRYVELAEKVIQELDSSPAQERMTKVYRLRNAQAVDIQTAMRNFLDQERQRLTTTLGANGMGSAQRLLEQEVAVVAEERTNALLLSASPRYFDTIEKLIDELDQPPPQVLVQVLLAIVKLTDNDDLGIEWQLENKWDDLKKSATGGTNFGVAASTDGFTLSVAAGDLRFFLRALERQNRLEVLSRPQILASDNQLANVNVGSRVPFITSSRVTDVGTTINTIQYEDIGIILNVTPRINPEGFVRMEVNPEISSLSNSTVTISEGVEAIIIDRRSAQTTVTVQDGHTIIIGGLIETKDEDVIKKVPWFGDLPWVGVLFRSTSKVRERSELLIILTPHVMRDIPGSDRVTDKQLQRMKEIRNFKREEIEDYMKRYLDSFFQQAAPRGGLGPTTQPTTQPGKLPWELPTIRPSIGPARPLTGVQDKQVSWPNGLQRLHAAANRPRR
jgi:type II secretion system protein D